jgi:hypothetical protein
MPARFTDIPFADFDYFIRREGYTQEPLKFGKEITYRKPLAQDGNVFIRVFSSFSKNASNARKKGSDAIRVMIRVETPEHNYMLWKSKRVHRVENWKRNLKDRIDEAEMQVHEMPCPKCGAMLLLRDGRHGEFYGCSNFAKTRCRGSRQA